MAGDDCDSSKPKPPPPAAEGAGEVVEGPVAADKALHALGFEFTRIGARLRNRPGLLARLIRRLVA